MRERKEEIVMEMMEEKRGNCNGNKGKDAREIREKIMEKERERWDKRKKREL